MICKSCGKNKKVHSRGICAQCYWVEYQREERRRDKKRAGNQFWSGWAIAPRKLQHMKPEQIVANWGKFLRAVGL